EQNLMPYMDEREELQSWAAFFQYLSEEIKQKAKILEENPWADEGMLAILEEEGAGVKKQIAMAFAELQERSAISPHAGTVHRLKEVLALTEFELFVVMLYTIVHTEPAFAGYMEELTGNRGAGLTLGNCLELYSFFSETTGREIEELLRPDRERNILFFASGETETAGTPDYARVPGINPKVMQFLQGNHTLSETLSVYARLEEAAAPREDAAIHRGQQKMLDNLIGCEAEGDFIIHLKGPDGIGKHHTLKKAAAKWNMSVIYLDFQVLFQMKPHERTLLLRQTALEAKLEGAKMCIEHGDFTEEQFRDVSQKITIHQLLREMQRHFGMFFLLSSSDIVPDRSAPFATYIIELGEPSLQERKELWEFYLKRYQADAKIDPTKMAVKYNYCSGDVEKTMKLAKLQCLADGDETVSMEHIMAAVRSMNINLLGTKAQFIRPAFSFADIVLEKSQMSVLRDFCNRILHRYTLMVEMDYIKKFPYGQSSVLLLYGPPGTGKTMTAQVVANELGMDLYKINLSQIFSKYIGDTEKQLEEIFSMAKKSNAVLFFDEADALFSKRTEVQDSHDKYANVEISYLLQKMEEFDGIMILATNNAGNMDPAFRRRMTASVGVEMPDAAHRMELWKKSFTAKTEISEDVEWNYLAEQIELPPSCIKQAALTASYLAVLDGSSVTWNHIMQAAKQEYGKLGKMFFD
ncbi:MAG: AAA family ATPase, partial [Bacillota bacterium]|nr:AAA family ATPase [Bacillota bacterium]